jgi:hypothetical protein
MFAHGKKKYGIGVLQNGLGESLRSYQNDIIRTAEDYIVTISKAVIGRINHDNGLGICIMITIVPWQL